MRDYINRFHRGHPPVRTSHLRRLAPYRIPDHQAQREAGYEAIARAIVKEN